MDIFLIPSPVLLVIIIAVLDAASGRYQNEDATQPGPSILLHKQALNDDGSFNYLFAADNGLRQGERILPDGTRVGAYSYVDPNGETISVKYKAGKDGFKILEGSHIPTPPDPALGDDTAEAATGILLPTPIVWMSTSSERPPPLPKMRERIKKETPPSKQRPLMKVPVEKKRIRPRGLKGALVMVHRMPNESKERVASFHVEQPTFRGQINKAESQAQPSREKPDFFGNKDNPKAYSFQFGSANN